MLDPRGPLFNDPRDVLEQELSRTANYYALLEAMAQRPALALGDLATSVGRPATGLPPFLDALAAMRLTERVLPFGAPATSKEGRYRLADPFLRFWFRFVFAYQEDLAAGLDPRDLFDATIAPALAAHVAPVFEGLCRQWVRREYGRIAPRVGSWWGKAAADARAQGRRSEEIDIVGGTAGRVALVGECKWTNRPLDVSILGALEAHKLPALRGSRLKVASAPQVVLFCRGGFTEGLRARAAADPKLRLVSVDELVEGLLAAAS